jgi:hypothetical protein
MAASFYCSNCGTKTADETCRDCGEVADELCGKCDQILDNCSCDVEYVTNPHGYMVPRRAR